MKGKKLISTLLMLSMIQLIPLFAFAETAKPTVKDFTKSGNKNTAVHFTQKDFNDNFTHEDAPDAQKIRMLSVPEAASEGELKVGEDLAEANNEYTIESMDTLVFHPATDFTGSVSFRWQAYNGTEWSENEAQCTIEIADAAPSPSPEPTETPTPAPTLQPLHYEDMPEHWAAYSAGMLGSMGVIVGEEVNGLFFYYPDTVQNRIEFITYANGVFGIAPADDLTNFPFADENLPGYVKKQAMAAYNAGILSGSLEDDGKLYLHPYQQLTRIAAIKIIDSALKVETPNTEPLDFADKYDIPEWGEQAVKNMEGYGIVRGYDDNTLRPWENLTKAHTAEMLYQSLKYEKQRALTNQKYLPLKFMK